MNSVSKDISKLEIFEGIFVRFEIQVLNYS